MTTVKVEYFIPDYPTILQEFVWQTLDQPPRFPRVKRFIHHWDENIEAIINEIFLTHVDTFGKEHYTTVDQIYYF